MLCRGPRPRPGLVHVPSGAEGHGVTFAARRVEPGLWDTPIPQVHDLDEISPRLAADLGRKVLRTVDAALEVVYPQLAEMARERAAGEGRTLVECSNVVDLRAWSDRRELHEEERAL